MNIYGVIGWKNAGKTSLMERLVAEISGRGLRVSTVKHVHHDVDLDQPGKDTYRHRTAGAEEVVLASANRMALLREHRGGEPELAVILARMAPVDLVLVEGYKRDTHPKIEVYRREAGHDLIQPGDPMVRAVATDAALAVLTVPLLDLNDTGAIADFILREVGLAAV
jgi:molybdopterin-guanine dinucleotide biosynthesis adapter protein